MNFDEHPKNVSRFMYDLAMSFPVFAGLKYCLQGVTTENFNALILDDWSKNAEGLLTSAEFQMCRFLLFVWNPQVYRMGFDLSTAAKSWDWEQRLAFAEWWMNGCFVER